MAKNLSPKEESFIREYLLCFNATEAYINSEYSTENCTRKSINRMASALLSKKKIKDEIKRRLDEIREDKEIVIEKMIKKCIQIMDDENVRVSDVISAMNYLGKLFGVGDKIEVKSENETQFNINIIGSNAEEK